MRTVRPWLAGCAAAVSSLAGCAAGNEVLVDATVVAPTDARVDVLGDAPARPDLPSPPDVPDVPDAPDAPDAPGVLPTGRLAIGFWCGVPVASMSAARFAEIAAAGFTFATNPCEGGGTTAAYNHSMLDLARAAGLTAIVSDGRVFQAVAGTNLAANLDAVVGDYAASPALAGYFLADEPAVGAFGALAAVVDGLRGRDPARLGYINLLPDYASTGQLGAPTYDAYVSQFLATVRPAAFSYDHYNFLAGGADGPTFFANLAVVRARAVERATPFWQIIQSISYAGHRAVTGPEKRWAALHTLAYGGAGVMYFTYWTPGPTGEGFGQGILDAAGNRTVQYAEVAAINQTLAAVGRYLVAATSTGVFHNGPLASGAVPRPPGAPVYVPGPAALTVGLFAVGADAYALLVNRDHAASTASDVYLAAADGAPERLDVATGRFVPMAVLARDARGARVHADLAAGDGLLVHLRGPVPQGAPGAEAYYGTVRADAGWLDVVDGSFGTQRLRVAGWNDCPAGYTLAGRDFQSNGFWLCARADLAGRTFYAGNVVRDAGNYYRVQGGAATRLADQGWDTCAGGHLLGHRFESNGFWLCLE